jgi:hypothetical protein
MPVLRYTIGSIVFGRKNCDFGKTGTMSRFAVPGQHTETITMPKPLTQCCMFELSIYHIAW